jgi:putative phage-type endonuclease
MLQGSEEWHDFRNERIGASDAPIIMGVSPWYCPQDLWELKVGLKNNPPASFHMQKGLRLEDAARQYFYVVTGYEVKPDVYFSPIHGWMMASVDGISKDEKILLEIKCPGKEDHCLAEQGIVPKKYYPQLQHQLAVLDLDQLYYLSFDGQNGHLILVERNQEYINQLIEKEFEFYQCMLNFIPPSPSPLTQDPRWEKAALQFKLVQKKQRELEMEEEKLKNTLIGLSNGHSVEGNGVKLTRYIRKGSVDYNRILEELNIEIDIEKYRKEEKEAWKITITG